MAAISLAAPGTTYGPCKETCSHLDCGETRIMAASLCGICGEIIGYNRRFYSAPDDIASQYVHASCYAELIEQARKKKEQQ